VSRGENCWLVNEERFWLVYIAFIDCDSSDCLIVFLWHVSCDGLLLGNHLIEVISDGEPVAGGSFTSKAYNTAAIAVSPVNMGVVGMPVEFSS